MKIAKVIDQFGWAYYFLDKEQQKYSEHEIIIYRHNEVDLDGLDAIYIHGPDISPEARDLCLRAKELNISVVGGHAGPVIDLQPYPYLDLAVGISPQTFDFCRDHYDCPVVFLPEGIDTNFFRPIKRPQPIPTLTKGDWFHTNNLPRLIKRNNAYTTAPVVGWAGRVCAVKRTHLLEQLDFNVKMQSYHGAQFFIEKSHEHMLRFYSSIDILVMTSLSECMPRVVLEACACGMPVICTDVGSIRMILDPSWIVPVNPERIVVDEINKRLHMLENKDLRQKVGSDNRRRVENLSWKVLAPYWDMAFTAARNIRNIRTINKHFGYGRECD